MSMAYEELLQAMLDKVPSNVDKREGSIIYDALAPCAYFLAQQSFIQDNIYDLVLPDSAVGDYLDRAVSSYNIYRKPATAAVRKMITSGAVDIGSRWGIGSLVYVVTEKQSDTAYIVECETAGEVGNRYSGDMQPLSNVSGSTASLESIITPGTDEETDEALRERFYQKVRLPATSGNEHHYKLWALEVPGVGDAKVFKLDNGPGTVTVLIVDSDKTVDVSLEAAVAAHIESVRPIGASVTVGSPGITMINVAAKVLLDGTKTMDDVLGEFKPLLRSYLKGLVFQDYRVSYAKIGSILLSTPGVQDYDHLTLNDTSGNITVGVKEVPAMGIVTLTEVTGLGSD